MVTVTRQRHFGEIAWRTKHENFSRPCSSAHVEREKASSAPHQQREGAANLLSAICDLRSAANAGFSTSPWLHG